MSGVIDDKGIQWERTNCCGNFVKLSQLVDEPPSPGHPYGRSLCPKYPNCAPTPKGTPT